MNRTEVVRRIAAEEVADMSVAELQLALMGHIMDGLDGHYNSDEELEELSPDVLSEGAERLVYNRIQQERVWTRIARLEKHLANGGLMVDFVE